MGNCVSSFQLRQLEGTGAPSSHPEKRGVAMGLPQCPTFPSEEQTKSFWMHPPSSIAKYTSSDSFPSHADVVIIGSGLSGASFARTLLDLDDEREDGSEPLKVVMLEAQDACSGATGRNGGHINPALYHDYELLKRELGTTMAQQIIRFRLAHFDVLSEVAAQECKDADCREVQTVDVFFDEVVFAEAKRKLAVYKADMPQEASPYRVWEGEEARVRFNLSSLAIGCITTRAGAVHPYRLVTNIISRLLEEYPKYFQLFTETPCLSITEPSSKNPFYTLGTRRGQLTASHVVHLTNAYVGKLVPGLAEVVYRIRETMSAQRPGRALQFKGQDDNDTEKKHGRRSYIFFDSPTQKGFDYLTQLSDGEHELMFGGGMEAIPETDIRDGSMYDVHSAAHVSGALPVYFGSHNWGAEALSVSEDAHEPNEETWAAGRVKAIWSGVLSVSVDERPWVGRIPSEISGRAVPRVDAVGMEKDKAGRTADPGEWVAAGYSGEGMVHAWLCARALALMVLGRENDVRLEFEGEYGAGQTVDQWLPACYLIQGRRWREACRMARQLRGGKEKVAVRGGAGKMKVYEGL